MSRALQINSSPQGWMARNTKPVPLAEKGWVITMKKISIRQHELSIFLKMTNECKRMSEISKCYTGEVDISLHSEFITNSSSDHSMLRGAQVQKYYITNDISQGDILFLKADGYLNKNKGEKSQHHKRIRNIRFASCFVKKAGINKLLQVHCHFTDG